MCEVTVVIPNYNGKKLLKNCLGTLEQQTVKNFKVLVIDNGSTDGSTEIHSEKLDMEMIALKEKKDAMAIHPQNNIIRLKPILRKPM